MNTQGFFDTPERTTAWVFRVLITLVGAAGTTVLWLAWGSLQDIKETVKEQNKTAWQAISGIDKTQSQMATTLGVLSQSVTDMKAVEQDHEGRIRVLERPAH